MSGLRLRPCTDDDAADVARLLGVLGYAASLQQAAARLRASAATAAHVVVAELEGRVVGLSVGKLSSTLTRDEPVARLALLVVDEAHRGRGIGRSLVEAFETWAAGQGAVHASLTSASRRAEAHAFYRACGWAETGVRFGRDLPRRS